MGKGSLVALTHGLDVQENATYVFDMMSGAAEVIEPSSTVVLEPNTGHTTLPEFAMCTHPETARAVIREVKRANPKRIIIAEAAAVGYDTDGCYEACDIVAVARKEGIELMDVGKDKDLISVAVRGYRSNISHVKLPRLLLEAGRITNLPILKTHASMVLFGALKSIKGVMQDQAYIQMHQQSLIMTMMSVWWAYRTDINIMGVMHATSGCSSHTPVLIEMDRIMGSYDPVALGRIACELVGIDPDGVDYFRVAQEADLGTINHDDIKVVGDKTADCYKKMWAPYLEGVRDRWPEYKVHCEGACSSCQVLLTLNMETLKAIDVYDDSTNMVVVAGGRNTLFLDAPDEKILLHGDYARKHPKEHPSAFLLQGYPPGEGSLYMSVLRKEAMTGKPGQMHWIRGRMGINAPV